MGFSIDWGTIVLSIPVILTTTIGVARFVVKTYFKEHIDRRLESFKSDLEKDMEKYKLALEKERVEHMKKLDSKIKISDGYLNISFTKIEELRTFIKDCFFLVRDTSPSDGHLLSRQIEIDLINYLDHNRMYFPNELIDLTQKFIKITEKARKSTYHAYTSTTNSSNDLDRLLTLYDNSHADIKNLEGMFHSIEDFLRAEYSNVV